jgi:biotin/methionine sulfoxide reductase
MARIQRLPHLAHWGAFTAVVEDGRLVRCEPFAADPSPSAMLESVAPMVYSERRIRRPAIRRSWLSAREKSDGGMRGREDFVEVGWDEALDLVASEVARVRAEHGASGLFAGSYGWSSAGRFHHARTQVRRFYFDGGGCVDQTGNYSWGTAQFLLPHVIGTYAPLTGRVTSWPSILSNAQVFVAFGGLALKNGQVAAGGAALHTQAHWLRELARSGIRVFNISPTREDCPDFVGAEWIPIRPNTDVALMLALAHEIYRRGAADHAFLARYCVGHERLQAYIEGATDGVPKSAAWAAGITGIPTQRIHDLANALCGVRSYITSAFAVQRAHRGEQPYWMLIALSAILGQIGLPGGGFGFGHGSMNGVGNPRVPTPAPEMDTGGNPARLVIPVARLTEMLESPGAPYRFDGRDHRYPDVRLVHWAGGNPFHHHQQLDRLRAAWARPETVIVNDIWWTAVARHADIVLPVTTTLERNDLGGSSRDPYVLAMHQAIAPLHHARSDFDIFRELAARLGHEPSFSQGRDEAQWLRAIYQRYAEQQKLRADIEAPDFDTFWREGCFRVPAPERDFILFEEFRKDPEQHPLSTPSGRIELFSATLESFAHRDIGAHPQWLEPVEWLGSAAIHEHPLHLVTVQPADRLHSQLDAAPLAQGNKVAGVECLTMHPDDARVRGIAAGDRVRAFNGRGACLLGVRLSADVMRGVVLMATGAWYDPDPSPGQPERAGAANVLTLDIGTSELSQGPNAMSCLVQVERWPNLPETSIDSHE